MKSRPASAVTVSVVINEFLMSGGPSAKFAPGRQVWFAPGPDFSYARFLLYTTACFRMRPTP
jgi:hypothetical protein